MPPEESGNWKRFYDSFSGTLIERDMRVNPLRRIVKKYEVAISQLRKLFKEKEKSE